MEKLKSFIITLGILFVLSLQVQAQQKETREVGSFNKIHSGGSFNVILEKGNKESVRLEGKNIDFNKVITEVKNNSLHIKLENGNYRNFDLTVYVIYTNLQEVHSSGSGNLTSKSDINASNLKISLSGSGNANLRSVQANDLEIALSGSGNLTLEGGSAKNVSIRQSGSGNVKSAGLTAENCTIKKSGSGNMDVNVSQSLEVESSGSGNIKYKGSPSINKMRFSGSGELVKI
jgi:hypothetical protein